VAWGQILLASSFDQSLVQFGYPLAETSFGLHEATRPIDSRFGLSCVEVASTALQ
jgi:hypothetical protein